MAMLFNKYLFRTQEFFQKKIVDYSTNQIRIDNKNKM